MPTPDRLRPAPYIAGLAGASTVSLIGVWLLIAPFAVGYQPDGADWVDATIVGVVTGAVLIALGLVIVLVLAGALRDEARRRGFAPRAVDATTDAAATGDADATDDEVHDDLVDDGPVDDPADLEAVLAPLAAALLEDLRNGHEDRQIDDGVGRPPSQAPADHPPA